jgi:hypothetical protein
MKCLDYRTYGKQLPIIAIVFFVNLMRWSERHHFHFLWNTWKDITSSYVLLCIFTQRELPSDLVPLFIAVLQTGCEHDQNFIALFVGKDTWWWCWFVYGNIQTCILFLLTYQTERVKFVICVYKYWQFCWLSISLNCWTLQSLSRDKVFSTDTNLGNLMCLVVVF